MPRKKITILIVIVGLLICFYLFFDRRAGVDFTPALKKIPQNAFSLITRDEEKNYLITPEQQKLLSNQFLRKYFSPWSQNPFDNGGKFKKPPLQAYEDVKRLQEQTLRIFQEDPGFGENHQAYHSSWINSIKKNMNLLTLVSDFKFPAITIHGANLRVLPTDNPSFGNWQKAGSGYPFDDLQESFIPANTPILVLHESLDRAWFLVLIHNDIGWVHSQDTAFVSKQFIQKWETAEFITPVRDNINIYASNGEFRSSEDIGTILPVAKKTKAIYEVLLSNADKNQNAIIELGQVDRNDAQPWPLPMTYYQMAENINHMIGMYYGWGGLNNYRDCSSTTMNLFASFGIWLPRNSTEQAYAGRYISLENLPAKKKMAEIVKNGKPFLTLLKLPGHIVLYVGQKKNNGYIFHDFWGLHTVNLLGESGRAIIGKIVITPLDFGKGYSNIPHTLIDKVQGMSFITT